MIMSLEDTKKLMNNIIENEFSHIQEYQERPDLNDNIAISKKSQRNIEIIQTLLEVAPEHKVLICDLENVLASYWVDMCKYYFKKGVIAGATNLNFLRDTNIVEYI